MPKKPTYDELKQRVKELELEATNGKLAQKALERKITELDSFINNIPDMAWIKDANSRFIVVNSAFGEIVGMNPKSLIHETCEVCFGKQEAKKFQEDDQKVLQNKRQSIIEEQIVDLQNQKIWLETIKSPILDESGKAVGTVGIARDITKRKQAEEALRKAHQELERKVEERTVELVKRYEQLKQETQEREQAENALRESKERYALATRAGKVGVWDWNMQTQKFYLDPNVKAILGYSDEEIPNDLDVWVTYVHPDDHQGVMEAFQAHIDGKNLNMFMNIACCTKTGPSDGYLFVERQYGIHRAIPFGWWAVMPTSPTAKMQRRPCGNRKKNIVF
jgi:PAS domain S-box-containing protein